MGCVEMGRNVVFCRYCGAEVESDALFCTSCGKRIAAAADSPANAADGAQEGRQDSRFESARGESASHSSVNAPKEEKEGVSPLCIAGCVLAGLAFFIDYFGIVALAAFFVSLVGYRKAKKAGQEGAILAIISMIISAVRVCGHFFWTVYTIQQSLSFAYILEASCCPELSLSCRCRTTLGSRQPPS